MIRTLIGYKYPLIKFVYFLLEHSRKKISKPIKTLMREYRTI